jgi:hypothetical protein
MNLQRYGVLTRVFQKRNVPNNERTMIYSHGGGGKETQPTVLQNSVSTSAGTQSEQPVRMSDAGNARTHKTVIPPAASIRCAYCKKLGHAISECWLLKRKNSEGKPESNRADNCLVSTMNERVDFGDILRETVGWRYRPHCFHFT